MTTQSGVKLSTGRIRPIAVGIIRAGGRILLEPVFDSKKGERFFRPLGGGVDFGERAEEALKREFREELGAELRIRRLLGVLENVFEFEGRPGHEIVFVFSGAFVDPGLNDREDFLVQEDGAVRKAVWIGADALGAEGSLVFPVGILQLMALEAG